MAAILRQSYNTGAILGAAYQSGDMTVPVWPDGTTLAATNKTDTTITLAASADATDAVGVAGYEWSSDDGATYPFTSLAKTFQFSALTANTPYPFRVRAYDDAGNRSAHLSLTASTYRVGALGQDILDDTGPIEGGYPGILFERVETGEEADWFWAYVTEEPATGVLTLNANGTYTFTGPDETIAMVQFGKNDSAVGDPVPVFLYTQAIADPNPPVLVGDITVSDITTTSYTLDWPAATGDVDGYEVSLTDGASYTDVGLVLTLDVTGRTPESTNYVRVRAYNDFPSTSAYLAETVELLAVVDETEPTLTLAVGAAVGATGARGTVTTDEAGPGWAVVTTSATTPTAVQIEAGQDHTGAAAADSDTADLVVGLNTNAFRFSGLTPETGYYLHVAQDDLATVPNSATPISSSQFTTGVAGTGAGLKVKTDLGYVDAVAYVKTASGYVEASPYVKTDAGYVSGAA